VQVTTDVHDGVATMTVAGEVDGANADELEAVFSEALGDGARSLVIDCAELAFIDSMGLAAIIAANTEAGLQFGTVTIRNASPMVLRLLKITGIDRILEIES
jgi:anti-sigma B factor antagonist